MIDYIAAVSFVVLVTLLRWRLHKTMLRALIIAVAFGATLSVISSPRLGVWTAIGFVAGATEMLPMHKQRAKRPQQLVIRIDGLTKEAEAKLRAAIQEELDRHGGNRRLA